MPCMVGASCTELNVQTALLMVGTQVKMLWSLACVGCYVMVDGLPVALNTSTKPACAPLSWQSLHGSLLAQCVAR